MANLDYYRAKGQTIIEDGIAYYRNGATREELIAWLCDNDPNGVYTDEASIQEFGEPASLAELRDCLERALAQDGYI